MPRTGGGSTTNSKPSWICDSALAEFGLNAARRLGRILGALLERLERDEDRARIGRVGEGGAGEADHVHAVRHAGHLQRDIERALLHRVGA